MVEASSIIQRIINQGTCGLPTLGIPEIELLAPLSHAYFKKII